MRHAGIWWKDEEEMKKIGDEKDEKEVKKMKRR